jgi:hypothetical protein
MRASITFSESGGKAATQEEVLPRDAKTLPPNHLLRSLGAGKFLPRSAKILPFNNLPLLLEPVALTRFF